MSEQIELRQTKNDMKVVGILKSKDIEIKQNKTSGKTFIGGHLIVEFTDKDNNINNVRVDIYSNELKKNGEPNKSFIGYQTIMNEYKDKDTFGDEADKIVVNGELNTNSWIGSQDGQLNTVNRINGKFINRLKNEYKPMAKANMNVIYGGSYDEVIRDVPTGRKSVILYSVGYGNKVYQLQDVFLPEKLVGFFESNFQPNQTLFLNIDFKNYAEVEEAPTEAQEQGFGEYTPSSVTKYVRELIIVGGQQIPVPEPIGYTQEEVQAMIATYKEQQATIGTNNTKPKTEVSVSGLDSVKSDMPATFGDDDGMDF